MQQPKDAKDMFDSGHADDAERMIQDQVSELLALPEEERDYERLVKMKINLVNIYYARDQFDEAFLELDDINRLIDASDLPGVKVLRPVAHFTRANTCYIAKMNDEARKWAELARGEVHLLEGQMRVQLEQRINHLLARYYCRVMDFAKAMKYAQEIFPPGRGDEETVVRKEREAKIKALLGQIQKDIALDMLDRGQDGHEEMLRMSRSFHLDARDLYRSLDLKRNEYYQLVMLAEANLRLRYFEDAQKQLDEGLEMARSMKQDPLVQMDIAERFGYYHLCLRETGQALDWMNKSLSLAVQLGEACLTDLIHRLKKAAAREGIDEATEALEKLIADLPTAAKGQQ